MRKLCQSFWENSVVKKPISTKRRIGFFPSRSDLKMFIYWHTLCWKVFIMPLVLATLESGNYEKATKVASSRLSNPHLNVTTNLISSVWVPFKNWRLVEEHKTWRWAFGSESSFDILALVPGCQKNLIKLITLVFLRGSESCFS